MAELGRAPLDAYLRRQLVVDVEMRKVLRGAIKSLDAEIARLAQVRGIGAEVRVAQMTLTREMLSVWRKVGTVIELGITDSADELAKVQAAFDKELMKKLGAKMDDAFKRRLLAEAKSGLESYISRRHYNMTLSERVYRNGKRSTAAVEQIINQGLISGRSAREIARMVRSYINPRTPGGLSYAAMRLARTELNNAFHETSIRMADNDPFVEAVKWNLSGSHPKPDICNKLATDVTYKGGKPGVYQTDAVPKKPHPQCLCFTTTVSIDEDTFLSNLRSGKYDNMADVA